MRRLTSREKRELEHKRKIYELATEYDKVSGTSQACLNVPQPQTVLTFTHVSVASGLLLTGLLLRMAEFS